MFLALFFLSVSIYGSYADNFLSCYCTDCPRNSTIGREVNGKCYFVPVDIVYKTNATDLRYSGVFRLYQQNTDGSNDLNVSMAEQLVSSLSSELYLRYDREDMILWFNDTSSHFNTSGLGCPVYNSLIDYVYNDCSAKSNAIFVADGGNYTTVDGSGEKEKRFELKSCGSNVFGVHREKRCFYLATDGQCKTNDLVLVVNSTFSYQSVEELVKFHNKDRNISSIMFMLSLENFDLNEDPRQYFMLIDSDEFEPQPRCYMIDLALRRIRRRSSDINCRTTFGGSPVLCQTNAKGLIKELLIERYTLFYYGLGVIGVLIATTIGILCVLYFQRKANRDSFNV